MDVALVSPVVSSIGEVVGKRVADYMKAQALTQQDLAKSAGTTQPTISALLSGETRNPSIALVYSIAHALSVSIDALTTPEGRGEAPTLIDRPSQRKTLEARVEALERDLHERTQDLANTTRVANKALKIAKQIQDEAKSSRRRPTAS